MEIITGIAEIRRVLKSSGLSDETTGFVPTMGCLHRGHISLVRKSVSECSKTVVSIFVNPTQFGPSEDFRNYPRDMERDIRLLKKESVDFLFCPSEEEMYGQIPLTRVHVSGITARLEGSLRPEHFSGVCTVVCKLLNIVSPGTAYFGWKDAQQLVVIRKMVKDLNMPVEIIGCPVVREKDGLAASSRNVYLQEGDRKQAVALYKGLRAMKELAESGHTIDSELLIEEGAAVIKKYKAVELQYLEIVNPENFEPLSTAGKGALILGAVKVGGVRLIDNMFVG